jgi:hypothetical protein
MRAQAQRLSSRRGALHQVVLAVALAAILGACGASGAGAQHPLPAASAGKPTAPGALVAADWVTYRDPAGFFTLRIPPQWHATVSTGEGWAGDRMGSYSYTSENVNLGPGTRLPRDTYVDVYIQPIPNAFARHLNCTAGNGPVNATVAGLPATDLGSTWLLNTEDAHFQISTPFSYNPGGVEIHAGSPLPTPVPPATVSAEQHLIEMVIATFRPIPATPLKCG